MSAMRLQFLKNAGRAAAKGGRLLRNAEAVIRFGSAAQRAKVVKKVLEEAHSLSAHETTAHVVEALCEMCDNTIRVQLLFSLRKRLLDLCRQRSGTKLLQLLLDKLPARNKEELAESISPEVIDLARHKVGSHVIRKMMETSSTSEIVCPLIRDAFGTLATNEVGQFVAATFVKVCPQEAATLLTEPLLDSILSDLSESEVLVAVVKTSNVPDDMKARLESKLIEMLPSLLESSRHNLVLAALCESSAAARRATAEILSSIEGAVARCVVTQGLVKLPCAILRHGSPDEAATLVDALVASHELPEFVAKHPYASTVLRAALDQPSIAALFPDSFFQQIASSASTLADHPAASIVLQRLLLAPGMPTVKSLCVSSLLIDTVDLADGVSRPFILSLATHTSGSFLLQVLLESIDGTAAVIAAATTPDTKKKLKGKTAAAVPVASAALLVDSILGMFQRLVNDAHGTHVCQKALAIASDEALGALALTHTQQLPSWALDRFGCFSVRALLRAAQDRGLTETRRVLMNALKPIVASLARSPWAGCIVLGAMLDAAGEELRTAIRNVVFLKCEDYLKSPQDAVQDPQVRPKEKRDPARRNASGEVGQKRTRSSAKAAA